MIKPFTLQELSSLIWLAIVNHGPDCELMGIMDDESGLALGYIDDEGQGRFFQMEDIGLANEL